MATLNREYFYHSYQSLHSHKYVVANGLNNMILRVKKLVKSIKNYRAAKPLLHATDRELADIGLTPDDLQFIRKAGFLNDPTRELARRAHYRNHKMTL